MLRAIRVTIFVVVIGIAISTIHGDVGTPPTTYSQQGTLTASPWPMFRHDVKHTGYTPFTGPATPTVAWTFSGSDAFASSPTIGNDGTIYVGAGASLPGATDHNLYALNPDGTLKWSYEGGDGFFSSPALGPENTIYVAGLDGAMDLQIDGQIKAERRVVPDQVAQAMDALSLDLTCRAVLSPQNVLDLKEFMIKNGNNFISIEGNADIKTERMDVRGLISGINTAPFLRRTGVSVEDLGPVRITAKGPFMQPNVMVTAMAGSLKTQGASLKDITLETRARFEQGFSGLKNTVVEL